MLVPNCNITVKFLFENFEQFAKIRHICGDGRLIGLILIGWLPSYWVFIAVKIEMFLKTVMISLRLKITVFEPKKAFCMSCFMVQETIDQKVLQIYD